MEIITGYTGENHVTSADDASLYRGILGQDDYVLDVGNKFAATIVDNNTVRVMDGDLVIQGHQARIRANDYNEVTIDNGTPGQKRNDLIVARYQKNTTTGVESITLEVVKGTPGATAVDPEITQGNLAIGDTQRDFALYRVSLNGLALESVTSLFTTIPNLKVLKTHMADYTSLLAELANTNAVTMINEPWNSTAPTTVDFGFKPSLVIVEAVVRNSEHQSTGVIRGTSQYARQHGANGKYDITGVGIVYFSNIAGSADDSLTGSANLTDTGIVINWSLIGAMTASGNRRMIITAFRDFPLG